MMPAETISLPANSAAILRDFPVGERFRFITGILELDEQRIKGYYDFRGDEFFFAAHFPGHPLVPGVILTEVMVQTGLLAFGMHLLRQNKMEELRFVLTESESRYKSIVYPGERVIVSAEKIFFRMNKLKVKAELLNAKNEPAATAVLSGMLLP